MLLWPELSMIQVLLFVHYRLALHLQPAYGYFGHKKGDFPMVETVQDEILSLPIFPELSLEQIKNGGRSILINMNNFVNLDGMND